MVALLCLTKTRGVSAYGTAIVKNVSLCVFCYWHIESIIVVWYLQDRTWFQLLHATYVVFCMTFTAMCRLH